LHRRHKGNSHTGPLQQIPRRNLPNHPTQFATLKIGLTSDTKATGYPVAFVFVSPLLRRIYQQAF
jgi:hypothetical protein